ncbi:MAG: protein kinase [Polyangiaceae bacterium]
MAPAADARDDVTKLEGRTPDRSEDRAASGETSVDRPPSAAISEAPQDPKKLGHYEVIRRLGQGGMGSVYLARDTRLGRRVALKLLLKLDGTHRARFRVEARATAQLSHENIVALHDIGEADNVPYLVLEYVAGKTLSAWMKERREAEGRPFRSGIPAVRIAEMMLPVARALAAAHAAGVVHRDLKPANVMLADSGAVKVLDFGVAKLIGTTEAEEVAAETAAVLPARTDDTALHLTKAGLAIGTYSYMAPEQWRGEPVDGRADLWALGVMMFELAAGKHPLAPLSHMVLLRVAKDEEPMPSVREVVPDIGRLGVVIDRCLIKSKEDRLSSATELCEELAAIARSPFGTPREDDEELNPYAGLSPFQERDAARFFGRETAVEQIMSRLAEEPFLALVGPSGAGKSSLLRAGVIPALKRSGDVWESFVIRPGRHPLSGVVELLVQQSFQRSSRGDDSASVSGADPIPPSMEPARIHEQLLREPGLFGAKLRARARRKLSRVLLFVDQFEEAFTLATEEERAAFFTCLSGAADDPSSPVRVVISIRQDFLDRVAASGSALAERVSRGTVLVGPLDRGGLQRALVEPCAARSYKLESEALLDEMIKELSGAASALPLLQFTAARLWEGRDRERRILTEASYRSFGGVGGALATHADGVLSSLNTAEQRSARILLLRLVTPERTRAIVTRRELTDGAEDGDLGRVLDRLVEARLLTLGRGGEDATVELVHESLLTTWPVLAQWLDDQEGDAHFRARLAAAAKAWEASDQDEGLLWRGDAAAEARRYRDRKSQGGRHELGARESAYLAAVIDLGDKEQRRRRVVLGTVIGALATFAVVVSVLSVRSSRDADRAEEQSRRAEEQSRRAESEKRAAEQTAAGARNATRMAVARSQRGGVNSDPTTALALLREIEPAEAPPRGFSELVNWARVAVPAEQIVPQDKVWAATYSPDGARVVLCTNDGMVRVRDMRTDKELASWKAHDDWITTAAFSPDGSRILTTSVDKLVKIWKADGTDPITLKGHENKVISGTWSPDGARVATTSVDSTVRVWRADGSGEPIVLRGHEGIVWRAGFSPDGIRIVTGADDRTVRVWSADGTGKPLVLKGHTDSVVHASFSPNGKEILSGGSDKTLRVWSADGKGDPRVMHVDNGIMAAAWSPDGERVAAGSAGNLVSEWEAGGHGPIVTLSGHGEMVTSLVYRPDGKRLLSASRDGTLRTWNVEKAALPVLLRGHTEAVQLVGWSPDGKRIVSAGGDKTVRLWSSDGVGPSTVLGEMGTLVTSAMFDAEGKRVVAGSYDGSMKVFRVDGSAPPVVLRGKMIDLRYAAFSPDGTRVAAASSNKTVSVWPADGKGEPIILTGHEAVVLSVAWSPDGMHVVSTSSDKTVRVWNADGTGEPLVLRGHDGWVWSAAFSPDGTRIASASEDRTVRVWRADGTGEPVILRGHEAVAHVSGDRVWSPDGKRIVSSSNDGTVRIWNADGSDDPVVFALPNLSESASFSPDGRRVAVALGDGTILVLGDLEPVRTPDDPRLWTETRYCMPLDVRRRLLDFPEDQGRADLERCLSKGAPSAR